MSSQGKGQGDLDRVILKHASGATAEIYLFGATLVSYKTPDGKDQIFCSPKAIFDGQKAIRGGVPIVFPQFGQPDKAMAQHGFARNSVWTVGEIGDTAEESHALFTLTDSPETREKWDHAFRLEYRVTLTAVGLKLSLEVLNTGEAAFDFHFLLHTYLQIPAIDKTTVHGLGGRTFIDKAANDAKAVETRADVNLPSFTDRIYIGEAPIVRDLIIKQAGSSCFALTCAANMDGKTTPCDVVVWNPYAEKSPGDLPPPAFNEFVCVEPGLVDRMHQLAPKARAELSQTIIPV